MSLTDNTAAPREGAGDVTYEPLKCRNHWHVGSGGHEVIHTPSSFRTREECQAACDRLNAGDKSSAGLAALLQPPDDTDAAAPRDEVEQARAICLANLRAEGWEPLDEHAGTDVIDALIAALIAAAERRGMERAARILLGWRESDWPEGFDRRTAKILADDRAAAIRRAPEGQ